MRRIGTLSSITKIAEEKRVEKEGRKEGIHWKIR